MLKLENIKGEQSMDVLAEIIDPMMAIAADEKAADLFGRKVLPEGMTVKEFVLLRIRKSMPELLRTHKTDLVKILSILSEMTEAEYLEQLTFDRLLLDLTDLILDPVFNAFFTMPQSMETSSGSASANTTE